MAEAAAQATAAPGGRRAQAAPKRSPTPKRIAIAAAVVAYLGLAAVGTAYVGTGGYLFIVHKQMPRDLSVRMLPELWEETAEHPRMRKKLKVSLLVAGFTLFAGIPLAILGATGSKRELHGSARWANHAEIRAAGIIGQEPGRPDLGVVLQVSGEHLGPFGRGERADRGGLIGGRVDVEVDLVAPRQDGHPFVGLQVG